MKVIFLDIDGVLNYATTAAKAPCGCIGIAEPAVRNLRKIIDATGAKIVLTSTWKSEWNIDADKCTPDGLYLDKKLKRHGIHILDKTKDHIDNRGEGIRNWLKKNDHVQEWIVIDDDTFPDYQEQGIIPRLVQTSFMKGGLLDSHVQQAIDLLKENNDA